jgi:hypothetical protein
MASWIVLDDLTGTNHAVGFSQSGSAVFNINRAQIYTNASTGLVTAWVTGNLTSGFGAVSASGVIAGRWASVGGRYTSISSRTAYLNGVAGTTNTSTLGLSTDFGVLNATTLGVLHNDNLFFFYLKGTIGESCIWNIDVGDSVMRRVADPATRFELWYPLRSPRWISFPGAATTTFIPLIGHGPGMSLAHVGGGLAGRAHA